MRTKLRGKAKQRQRRHDAPQRLQIQQQHQQQREQQEDRIRAVSCTECCAPLPVGWLGGPMCPGCHLFWSTEAVYDQAADEAAAEAHADHEEEMSDPAWEAYWQTRGLTFEARTQEIFATQPPHESTCLACRGYRSTDSGEEEGEERVSL